MAAGKALVHRVHHPGDAYAGLVHVGEEHGRAPILALRHDDGEARADRAGGEPLGALNDIMVAVAGGGGQQRRRVRPGAGRRLGHAEAGPDLPSRQRTQPTLLLLGRGDHLHQVHVALVRRGQVHRQRPEDGVARLLEHDGPADMTQPQPAILLGNMRGEQPGVLRQRIQLPPQLVRRTMPLLPGIALQRDDLVADEGAGAVLQVGQLGRDGEVHGCGLVVWCAMLPQVGALWEGPA